MDDKILMIHAINAMQLSSQNGMKDLDADSKETTVINQIFGGFLRSQIVCQECQHTSTNYERFMDLNLDINEVKVLTKALKKLTADEPIKDYQCGQCKKQVTIHKSVAIEQPPKVLTLQLNRFCVLTGAKLMHPVAFKEFFNLRKFMSQKEGKRVWYRLYAVIVHNGLTPNSGHYKL